MRDVQRGKAARGRLAEEAQRPKLTDRTVGEKCEKPTAAAAPRDKRGATPAQINPFHTGQHGRWPPLARDPSAPLEQLGAATPELEVKSNFVAR
jgi:hypothetical protein